MRRARKPALLRPALFRYALAAALAAVTLPFIAHAAFGDEAVAAPAAQIFPTRAGIGVVWDDVDDASGYRVERKQDTADWQDVSGALAASTTSWIDETIAAGATADYRVVATSDSEPAPSPAVTATRVTEAPVVGDVDVLALDANRGAGVTWLQDETAGPVTASAPADGSRTLTAGSISLKIPAFLAGPGNYNDLPIELTQGDRSCTARGYFRVTALSYTPDLRLETFAAAMSASSCTGSAVTTMFEIRYRSAVGYQSLSVTPEKLEAGRVMVGSAKNLTVTLKNTGTEPVKFGQIGLSYSRDWTLAARDCELTLPANASCTLTLRFAPEEAVAESPARLMIDASTSLSLHSVPMTGTGISLPKAPQLLSVLSTFTGLTVRWEVFKTAGGTPVRGYSLHRYLNDTETTQWIEPSSSDAQWVSVTETAPKPGTEYAVSVVNEVGEGTLSPRKTAVRAAGQIAITAGQPGDRELMAADLAGYVVPFPADDTSIRPKEAVTSAPDGRSLAYVTNAGERVLWSRQVTPDGLGVPVKLWTSPAPVTHLSWSPDGARIAFQSPESGTPCVYVISAAGGTPVKVACDLTSPSWMPDAQTLVVVDRRLSDDRLARIEAKTGGPRVATLPARVVPADGTPVRVSPDGRLVAFGSDSNVHVVDFTSDTVRQSPPIDASVRAIGWNSTITELLALSANGKIYRLFTDPLTRLGETPTLLPGSGNQPKLDLAWQQLGVVIKPTPAMVGAQVSIPFDTSALPPGTTFTCTLGFTSTAPCASPFTAANLPSGANTLTITATEPTGRVTKAFRTFTVDATGPVARMVGPAYQSSVAATATLTVSATDANGVASYDVQYRRATSAGPYGAYVQPWTNTTATSMNLAVAAGYEYCVSVRAKDKLGNVGQWSAERCFSRPLDDRSLTLASTGWTRATGSTFYYGTTTQTTAYGKSLTRTVQGKRFFLVATRCPTCGSVAVYAGNRYLTTVNLAYPTTHRQVLLGLPVQSTLFSGTLKFVSASTGKLVQIDGLAVGRT